MANPNRQGKLFALSEFFLAILTTKLFRAFGAGFHNNRAPGLEHPPPPRCAIDSPPRSAWKPNICHFPSQLPPLLLKPRRSNRMA